MKFLQEQIFLKYLKEGQKNLRELGADFAEQYTRLVLFPESMLLYYKEAESCKHSRAEVLFLEQNNGITQEDKEELVKEIDQNRENQNGKCGMKQKMMGKMMK